MNKGKNTSLKHQRSYVQISLTEEIQKPDKFVLYIGLLAQGAGRQQTEAHLGKGQSAHRRSLIRNFVAHV